MLGRNQHEQGILKLEDAAGGNSLSSGGRGVKAVAYPVHALRGSDGTPTVGSWHCNGA